MDTLYRSATGEVRTYEGWRLWAEEFYNSLSYDEFGRDTYVVKHLNIMMPHDWFKRASKVLKLEPIGAVYSA